MSAIWGVMGNNIDEVIDAKPYQLDSEEGGVIIKDNCLLGTDQPELNSKSDENKGIMLYLRERFTMLRS